MKAEQTKNETDAVVRKEEQEQVITTEIQNAKMHKDAAEQKKEKRRKAFESQKAELFAKEAQLEEQARELSFRAKVFNSALNRTIFFQW